MLDHLSYSSVALYQSCPRAWRFRYIEKPITPTSANLVFGSAFHKAVETIIERRVHGQFASLESVWDTAWEQQLADNVSVNWNGDDESDLRRVGSSMLCSPETQRVLAELQPMIEDGQPTIEKKITLHVPGVPIEIIGYVDLIDIDGIPHDMKTAGRTWTQQQADSEEQATFYLAALNQMGYAANPERRFRYVVWCKGKSRQVQTLETSRTFADMFRLFSAVSEVWKGIQLDYFPPNTTTWKHSPKYCDYWSLCPAGGKQ